METLRLSRSAFQLIGRPVEALERIGRELERYNDRHERIAEEATDETSPDDS